MNMDMKKILLFVISSFFSTVVSAQLSIGKSAGQIITENAVKGSVVIVKQSYQVKSKKNGKVFGRNGKKEFGQHFSIGVITENGLVLTEASLKPWIDDKAFKSVEDNYEPFISLTEIRAMEGKEQLKYVQCPLQIGNQQPNGIWIAQTNNSSNNSMEIDPEEGNKDGWLIWYTSKESLYSNSESSVSIQTINKKLDINGGDIEIGGPSNSELLLGGIYVTPIYLGGGHISFKLVGIAIKENDKWTLRTPFIGYSNEKTIAVQEEQLQETVQQEEEKTEESQEEIELTPVAQDKKTKKNKKK